MKMIAGFISLILMAICLPTFADKVIITGQPLMLEQQGEVYLVPKDYTSTTGYYYVSVNGTNRVCYLEAQPAFANLDLALVNVNYNGQEVVWNCYAIDDTIFEITP